MLLMLCQAAYLKADCIVEILSSDYRPSGFIFKAPRCTEASQQCERKLNELRWPRHQCAITDEIIKLDSSEMHDELLSDIQNDR